MSPSSRPLISIVIVDFKKGQKVVENVSSLLKQKDVDLQIIIADNSQDKKNEAILKPLKKHKNVSVTINKENTGYSKANNKAAQMATGDFICFVNPDIVWTDINSLKVMSSFIASNKEVGMIGPKQITPDGSMEFTARAFPYLSLQIARRTWLSRLPFISRKIEDDLCTNLDYSKNQEVDWLQSSCIMISMPIWKDLKGFDERFFIFLADTDICWRIWGMKKKVLFFAETKVSADGIRASEGGFLDIFSNWILRQHLKDAYAFFVKHRRQSNPRFKKG